jgi:hypothetical protein
LETFGVKLDDAAKKFKKKFAAASHEVQAGAGKRL